MNAAYLCLAASLCTLLGGCGSPELSVSPTRAEGRCDAALVGTWQMPEKPDAGIRIDAQCRIHDRNGSNPWAPSVHTAPSPRGGERLAWLQTPPDEGGRWLLACYRVEGDRLRWGMIDPAEAERAVKSGAIRGQLPSGPYDGPGVLIIDQPIEAWPESLRNDACRPGTPEASLVRVKQGDLP